MGFGQYFWVYFNPNGRLPRDLYRLYGVPVAVGIFVIHAYMSGLQRREEPLELWLLALFSLLTWMHACVMSRRLRDCGISGALSIAIACVLIFDASTVYFPDLLGDSDEIRDKSEGVITLLLVASHWIFKFACAACILREGDSGANNYGAPLGTLTPQAKATLDARRRTRLEADAAEQTAGRQQRKTAALARNSQPLAPLPPAAARRSREPARIQAAPVAAPVYESARAAAPQRQVRQGFGKR